MKTLTRTFFAKADSVDNLDIAMRDLFAKNGLFIVDKRTYAVAYNPQACDTLLTVNDGRNAYKVTVTVAQA